MRFLINATHDIRSPLTLILGPLNKLKQRVADPQSLDDINTIDRNAQRLLLLVNQILDERKIDKNQMRLHCSPTDLVGFIAGICSLYQYNARQRNINFNFEHADSKLMAWIDRKQFDKVVSNLLSNAFKYSQDGGQITVTLSSDGNNANLLVADTGIGFGSENTDKLFERFYQGRNTSLSHLDGTGIGLNLSRSIVLLHGGEIKPTTAPTAFKVPVWKSLFPWATSTCVPNRWRRKSLCPGRLPSGKPRAITTCSSSTMTWR